MTDRIDDFAPAERPAPAPSHEQQVQRSALVAGGAWGEFLRKVLPPVAPQSSMRLVRIARA